MYPDTHRRTRGNSLILSSAVASLMNRHSQWVYRTLEGLLGNQDVARDAILSPELCSGLAAAMNNQ
jgi:hypothetical protein